MCLKLFKALFTILLISIAFSISQANEIKSRYTTITFSSEDQLRRFNREISLGSLSYLMQNRKNITIDDEVKNKVDIIIERVETILEMYPKELKFSISLLSSEEEVQKMYKSKYGKNVDFIAFYAPKDKTIYISVKDVDVSVLAHEIAHVIIDFYYGVTTPTKIHEVLAQYVEKHLKD